MRRGLEDAIGEREPCRLAQDRASILPRAFDRLVFSQTVEEVKEACATIRKAMVQINELSATMSAQNINQMTRWVNTKEEHAKKIITIISGSGPVAIIAFVALY
jgi:hypothetical protein